MRGKLFFGGVPTQPDVDKLFEALGAPEPGLITYWDLERIVSLRRGQSRFQTVVTAWRKKLLAEHNIATKAMPGKGIKVLTEPERVDHCASGFVSKTKQLVKNIYSTNRVVREKLDPVSEKKHDHLMRVQAGMAPMLTGSVSSCRNGLKEIAGRIKK